MSTDMTESNTESSFAESHCFRNMKILFFVCLLFLYESTTRTLTFLVFLRREDAEIIPETLKNWSPHLLVLGLLLTIGIFHGIIIMLRPDQTLCIRSFWSLRSSLCS